MIVAVNALWRAFALANPIRPGQPAGKCDLGANYLDICQQVNGADATEAMLTRDGILDVLQNRRKTFTLEYRCDSPGEPRWFSMVVSPLGQVGQAVVVSHSNITERKLAERPGKRSATCSARSLTTFPT